MSRKKGIIENPDWEEEVNDTSANQDDETQKKIEEMYKSLHSKNKKDGAEKKKKHQTILMNLLLRPQKHCGK